MKERDVIKIIRTEMLRRLNVKLHKYFASVYGEIGVADLFGTLPNGRAIFIETKAPGEMPKSDDTLQHRWLAEEASRGAFCIMTDSWEALEAKLKEEKYL